MDLFPACRPDMPVTNAQLAIAASSAALTNKPREDVAKPTSTPPEPDEAFLVRMRTYISRLITESQEPAVAQSKCNLAFAVRH